MIELGRLAVGDAWPHLTIVLDVSPEVGFERTGRSSRRGKKENAANGQMGFFPDANTDAMERRSLEFHRRVRELFRALPDVYPTPVEVIDAERDADAVFAAIQEAVGRAFQ